MKNKLNYILLILTLNFSCVEKKATEGETNKFALKATSKTDTLKFTSGIRSIFQEKIKETKEKKSTQDRLAGSCRLYTSMA